MSEQVLTQLNYIKSCRDDMISVMSNKGLEVSSSTPLGDFANLINQLPALGQPSPDYQVYSDADVVFYDYNGEVLYEYTAADFLELTALPALPTHTGLTAQEWNYSLSDAQTYVNNYGKINIGATYITTSGETEIDIELPISFLSPTLGLAVNGSAVISWGDGSTNSITGTSLTTVINTPHTYTAAGEYTISIAVSGSAAILGSSSYGGSQLLWAQVNSNMIYSNNTPYRHAIKNVRIGSNITTIGAYAFRYCRNLYTITIPNTITTIGTYAFSSCYGLVSIIFPVGVNYSASNVCSNCYNLCSVSLTYPFTTNTASSFFSACYKLNSVTIPEGSIYLSDYFFAVCYTLKNVIIPNSITNIRPGAFQTNYSLIKISLPKSNLNINDFLNCYNLKQVLNQEYIKSMTGTTFQSCYSLDTIYISSSITTLPTNFAYGCCSLKEITIPSNVQTINGQGFASCSNLQKITLEEGIQTLGTSCFYSCESLQSITIPKTISSIGASCFNNCYSLAFCDLSECETVPTLSGSCFANTPPGLKIYVPSALLSQFQSATNWSAYASQMVGV